MPDQEVLVFYTDSCRYPTGTLTRTIPITPAKFGSVALMVEIPDLRRALTEKAYILAQR